MTGAKLLVFLVPALLGVGALGRLMDHCQLASELQRLGAPRNQISTWVCIAKWESSYNTAAVGPPNSDGSRDHGIFQINDRYWCSPPGTGCGVSCRTLEGDDIAPSWKCAKRIYKATKLQTGNGFKAWTTYAPHCAGDTSSYVAGCRLMNGDNYNDLSQEAWAPYKPHPHTVAYALPWYHSGLWAHHQIFWNKPLPVVLSLPHFYQASSYYQNGVGGLNPDKDTHITYLEIEPITGIPVRAAKRIQINFQMKGTPAMSMTKKTRDVLIPFMWINESFELGSEQIDLLKDTLLKLLKTVNIVKWVLIAIGSLMVLVGSVMAWISARRERRYSDGRTT